MRRNSTSEHDDLKHRAKSKKTFALPKQNHNTAMGQLNMCEDKLPQQYDSDMNVCL